MTRAQIASLALAKLDEISPFDTSDVIPSVLLVEKLMDESAKSMLRNVPIYMAPPTDIPAASGDHVYDPATGVGYIKLPADFIRLHSFMLTEWARVVNEAISQQHPKYNLQKNTVTRGKPNKPVVVVRHLSASQLILEYFSSNLTTPATLPAISLATYVKVTLPENIASNLTDMLTWYVAYDTAIAMNDTARATAVKQRINEITQSITI